MDRIDVFIDRLKDRKIDFERAARLQTEVWEGEKPHIQPLLLSCSLDENDDEYFPQFNLKGNSL